MCKSDRIFLLSVVDKVWETFDVWDIINGIFLKYCLSLKKNNYAKTKKIAIFGPQIVQFDKFCVII